MRLPAPARSCDDGPPARIRGLAGRRRSAADPAPDPNQSGGRPGLFVRTSGQAHRTAHQYRVASLDVALDGATLTAQSRYWVRWRSVDLAEKLNGGIGDSLQGIHSWTLPDGPAGAGRGDCDFELVTPVNNRGRQLPLPTSYAFGADYVFRAGAVLAVGFEKRSIQ